MAFFYAHPKLFKREIVDKSMTGRLNNSAKNSLSFSMTEAKLRGFIFLVSGVKVPFIA
jgi:hypothetical protein